MWVLQSILRFKKYLSMPAVFSQLEHSRGQSHSPQDFQYTMFVKSVSISGVRDQKEYSEWFGKFIDLIICSNEISRHVFLPKVSQRFSAFSRILVRHSSGWWINLILRCFTTYCCYLCHWLPVVHVHRGWDAAQTKKNDWVRQLSLITNRAGSQQLKRCQYKTIWHLKILLAVALSWIVSSDCKLECNVMELVINDF